MNHWKSALSLALVPAFALTFAQRLPADCRPTCKSPPIKAMSFTANTWGG